MFETIYLTSAEKSEFLQEFVNGAIEAMPKKIEVKKEISPTLPKEDEKAREEALEKVRLIIRQFPGMAGKEPAREEQESEPVEAPIQRKQSLALQEDIDRLLNDASVNSVEISEGNILIKKGASFEDSGIKISGGDLKQVIQKISEKTKIPMQEGVFKARLDDMSISAVVSDLIGNSILIIKDRKS